MRIVFMGTPNIAASILEALTSKHQVVGVFTRPDAVRGRGKNKIASPVKDFALNHGLDVFTPQSLCQAEEIERLIQLKPDVICVVSYGLLLPPEVLQIASFGCLNVHMSLLPRWRGAAPLEQAILAGDEKTGVCIMRMEEGLDTGPVCERREIEIGDLYLADLIDSLAHLGAEALLSSLEKLESAQIEWVDQEERGVTYAHKLSKQELALTEADDLKTFSKKVRASSVSRPAKLEIAGRCIAVGRIAASDEDLELGKVILSSKRLIIGLADGAVELLRVKPDGKQSMDGYAFALGIQDLKTQAVTWSEVTS